MAITSIQRDWGVGPSAVRITSTDALSVVTSSGYLTAQADNMTALNNGVFGFIEGDTVLVSANDGSDLCDFIGDDFTTLHPISGGGSVVFPITVPQGGTDLTSLAPYELIAGGTTSTNAMQQISSGTSGQLLKSNGPGALPTWINSGSSVTPSPLTEVDDTNVSLTLSGTPATALLQPVLITVAWTGLLAVSRGGTGLGTFTPYALIAGGTTGGGNLQQIATGTSGQVLVSSGGAALPVWANASSIVTGAALTEVNDTNVTLTLGGTPSTALLQATSLTLGWTGQLAVSRGGSGQGTLTPYSVLTGGTTGTGAMQQVASVGTAGQVLTSSGAGALPVWATGGSVVTPSALTEVNDTNVTLTLGGTPATALLQAASITAGWTGTLAVPRGGLGVGTLTPYSLIVGGTTSTGATQQVASLGTSGQVLTSAGAGALPTWTTTGSVSSGLINQVAWYAATGTAVSGITIVNNAGLLTSAGGVPGWVAYTGTGAPVLATSPTLITPNLGVATATSIVFSPTTSGIIGITDASNAATGVVGEFITTTLASTSGINLTSNTTISIVNVSLTAGDWEVWAVGGFLTDVGNTTVIQNYESGISLVDNTQAPEGSYEESFPNATPGISPSQNTPRTRVNITTTTTVYLVVKATFTVSTLTGYGTINARRIR